MKVSVKNYSTINFKSRNNPVTPFVINTQKGNLFVKEFREADAKSQKQSEKLAKFFVDGFISNTKDPWFLSLKDKNNKNKYKDAIKHFAKYYSSMFEKDDGNLTILVACNEKNKLCGAVVTNTLNEAGVVDSQTCYIDSIAVDPVYRKQGIGKLLMEKAISCSKDIYTDSFLASDNMAVAFQERNGYKALDYSNPLERKIIDKINATRGDYPEYITFMHKKLKDNSKDNTWANRIKID